MQPKVVSKTLTAASANCIALSQSVAAGAKAIINGASATAGAFTLDTQRRVVIVSAANDAANTAHIYGQRGTGQAINEILALTNAGTAVSTLDYFSGGTVTFPTGTAGAITIGTNTTGSTDWAMPNFHLTPFSLAVAIENTTTATTYSVEFTQDPYWYATQSASQTTPGFNVGTIIGGATLAAAAGTIANTATVTSPVTGYRLTINAGTTTVTMQATQAGIIN